MMTHIAFNQYYAHVTKKGKEVVVYSLTVASFKRLKAYWEMGAGRNAVHSWYVIN